MEKKPLVISGIQLLLFLIIFIVPLFSLNYLAYSVIEKTLFFYALVEIAFFLWLYTSLKSKAYLPRYSLLLLAAGTFLAFYTLAGLLSASPEIAFWSTMTRVSGLVLLFHLAAFVLILVTTVRDNKTWRRIMGALAIAGALTTLPMHAVTLFGGGEEVVKSTFGNDSYTAASLTFSFFFSLILFIQSKSRKVKIFFALSVLTIILAPVFLSLPNSLEIFTNPIEILGTARAASVSILIGLILSVSVYLATSGRKIISHIGTGVLVTLLGGLLILSIMVFVPGSLVQQKLGEVGIGSRIVFWESATLGISEKPLLGFGPEHYFVPFYQHFDPALLTAQYGYEWFTSKPHSAYLEVLVSGGVLSFIPYMAIWFIAFFLLWRMRKDGRLQRGETALWAGLLVAYLIQNIVLFDTLSSYMGIGLVIAYLVYASQIRNSTTVYPPIAERISWPKAITCLGGLAVSSYFFVIAPFLQQARMIHIIEQVTVVERPVMYEELFALSSNMRISMAEYLMAKALEAIPPALEDATPMQKDLILKDLSSLRQTAQMYVHVSDPVHYRPIFYLARLHLLEFVLEQDMEKRQALLNETKDLEPSLEKLSPGNPQNQWIKAQRELLQGEGKAALSTLKETNEYAPEIPGTTQKIQQVEAFLAGESNMPFFIY